MKLMGVDIGTIIIVIFTIGVWLIRMVNEYKKSKKKIAMQSNRNMAHENNNKEEDYNENIIFDGKESDDFESAFEKIFNGERVKVQDLPKYDLELDKQPIDVLPDEDFNNSFQNDVYEEGACSIDPTKYDMGEEYLDKKEINKTSIKERIIKNKKDFIIFGEILKPKF